jgi:ADP-heptose:LPS heptosyltransferase
MDAIKRLERWAKVALAAAAAVLLWRPRRRARASRLLSTARRILLVRIDDRVGEALLLTPLLSALKARLPSTEVHALVHARCERILRGHPALDRLIGFDRRLLILGPAAPGIRRLRRERYDAVVDCGNWTEPSVTSALVSRLIGPRSAVIGPELWPVSHLHTHSVASRRDTRQEIAQRLHLLSPLVPRPSQVSLSFRRPQIGGRLRPLLEELEGQPFAVVNPGGRIEWRRIPPTAFAAAARSLSARGIQPLITWGPGEEPLARSVAELAPGSRVAPSTDIDELAAILQAARLSVCNNTGPMHLSVAVGTPTLGLFLRMDVERWGHREAPHRMLDLTPLLDSGRDVVDLIREEVNRFVQAIGDRRSARADPLAAP